ncbi:hypothetical protein RRG08_038730 [Elysia crispata]|uniref:Uncharacterized protein n=1 Tax=Elysia crispata TaxID=231223 RepID=A0AAE1DGV9_9GAST|nr:hypothetical protein RRG08_038730 [Elysia crispata]
MCWESFFIGRGKKMASNFGFFQGTSAQGSGIFPERNRSLCEGRARMTRSADEFLQHSLQNSSAVRSTRLPALGGEVTLTDVWTFHQLVLYVLFSREGLLLITDTGFVITGASCEVKIQTTEQKSFIATV